MLISPDKFTPLAVGETDWRAFDFTKDLDGEVPSNPQVYCTWAGSGAGSDAAPQAIVGAIQMQNSITEIKGPANTSVTKTGKFLCVYVGPPPSTAAGGAYQLQATVDTPTRAGLSLAALLPCTAV